MPEGLATPDGTAVDVQGAGRSDADFAKALAKPVADIADPPDVDPEKPKTPRRPRTTKGPSKKADAPKPVEVIKDDYTKEAEGLVASVWMVTASLPPTSPYAVVLHQNAEALAGGLAAGAKKSPVIRRALSQGGDSAWMLQLAVPALSITFGALQILKDPELRAECRAESKKQLRAYLTEQGVHLPEDKPAGPEAAEQSDGASDV